MATKTNNKRNVQSSQSDNSVVYKVAVALALLCMGLVALRKVHKIYSTIGGMAWLEPIVPWIMVIGFALCAVCIALYIFCKAPACRIITPWLIFIFAMVGITGFSMKTAYTFGFPALYFLFGTVLLQYIIYQLYRWEFFFASLPTAAAGFLFYQYRNGFSFSLSNLVPLLVTALILIGVIWIAVRASGSKGQLVFGGKSIRLFSKRYNPFLHYLVCALWIVCIPAAILLGSLFSFYCMFAAIAVEFIAAVYYTFQLN